MILSTEIPLKQERIVKQVVWEIRSWVLSRGNLGLTLIMKELKYRPHQYTQHSN
jgi:hypothetical protein